MMTELEAKTKWCSEARIQSGGAYNRDQNGAAPKMARCLASECMHWRWVAMKGALPASAPTHGGCGLSGGQWLKL